MAVKRREGGKLGNYIFINSEISLNIILIYFTEDKITGLFISLLVCKIFKDSDNIGT